MNTYMYEYIYVLLLFCQGNALQFSCAFFKSHFIVRARNLNHLLRILQAVPANF